MNLNAIDVNLLVTLDVLLREESVTEAAKVLGLSQSAVSHALSRLRDLFDDELLVRSGRSMVRTGRGEELMGPLRQALGQLEAVVSAGGEFEPDTSEAEFRIGANDYGQFVLLPPLIEALQAEAPRVNLRVRELGSEPPTRRLAHGDLDVALTLGLPEHVSPSLYRRDLFKIDLVSLVREGHPKVGKTMELDCYCELPHILVSPLGDDEGVVDMTLRRMGRRRRVALVVPHFMIAPHLVATTDMILTTSRSVAESYAKFLPIRLLEPPLELERGTLSMVWHPRSHGDEGHRWLRRRIRAVADDSMPLSESRAGE
jgi:DNA-binding transcriptional LysR family regulator